MNKRLSTPAIKHLAVLNMATAILQVRKYRDVTSKAVNITKDKKVLNQKRKEIIKIDNELTLIIEEAKQILSIQSNETLKRIAKLNKMSIISKIPETTTNPETLALNMLYLEFNDLPDERMDSFFDEIKKIDFMDLIERISEDIGLEADVSEDMYVLADKIIMEIKR